jgi:hypothetical protein
MPGISCTERAPITDSVVQDRSVGMTMLNGEKYGSLLSSSFRA